MNNNLLTRLIWQLLTNKKIPSENQKCQNKYKLQTYPYFQPICLITRLFIGITLFASPAIPIEPIKIDALIRTRCATDGKDVYTQWQGAVYAFVPEERQRKLFDVIGMNVARCYQNKQGKKI